MANTIGIEVTLGSSSYSLGAGSVRSESCFLPGINRASIVIPVKALKKTEPGDPASISLVTNNKRETVLMGKIKGIKSGMFFTTIIAGDNSAVINSYRPAVTYQKQSASGIIRSMASDAGVSTKTITGDLKLVSYAANQARTAGEHTALLARLSGCIAFVDRDNDLNVISWPAGSADVVLSYGRDIISYRTWERKIEQAPPVAVGNGPAGSVDAPDALKQTKDFLPQTIDPAGTKARWQAEVMLKTPQDALSAGLALQAEQGRAHNMIEILCILLPQLEIGMLIDIKDVPGNPKGSPWVVSGIIHEIRGGDYAVTRVSGIASSGISAGGLL